MTGAAGFTVGVAEVVRRVGSTAGSISTSPIVSEIHFAACGSRAKKDLRRRLGQHRLGIMAIPRFELTPSLKPEHHGIVRLPVFRDGRVECGKRCKLAS